MKKLILLSVLLLISIGIIAGCGGGSTGSKEKSLQPKSPALSANGEYLAEYYVSASGDDTTGDGSFENPWATLKKTADAINGAGTGGNYLVVVMTDLTSTACARYYNNSVTITSLGSAPCTVTRGNLFDTQPEPNRGWYNPAMLELGNTGENLNTLQSTLTLLNIIFDDAGRHQGTSFTFGNGTTPVQDSIVASYDSACTIILDEGAVLKNFGGMSAIRITFGSITLKRDSLITDTSAITGRPGSGTYGFAGDAAVSILGGNLDMQDGAKITNIADVHGIHVQGSDLRSKIYINGIISGLRGNRCSGDDSSGRGSKNALFFDSCITVNPNTGSDGPAIIGPQGNIVNNDTKCGAVQVRGGNTSLKIYGKVNDNTGLSGIRTVAGFNIAAGTNGGGLYIIGGGIVYLEAGSELHDNTVTNSAYGGAASVQQGNSQLIMNGGTLSGNSAPNAPDIAVNKHGAKFIMNGGTITNTAANSVYLMTETAAGYQTDGIISLNSGSISSVTVQNTNVYGNITQRHLYINEGFTVGVSYVSVAGRQVIPMSANFRIGNPNTANYTNIKNSLPSGYTMPTTVGNVIGFWIQKDGSAVFSVPRPTSGTGGANYNSSNNTYFAAVQETLASGLVNANSPVKFYPTQIVNNRIVVSIPISGCANGVTVALVQPSAASAL